MYISGGNNSVYSTGVDSSNKTGVQTAKTDRTFTLAASLNGKKPIISSAGPTGSICVALDDSYTEENPMMIAKGVDSNGKEYEMKIDPRKVNPSHANSVEMGALAAYKIHTGEIKEYASALVHPHGNPQSQKDIFDSVDFASDITQFAENQKGRDTDDIHTFLTNALGKMMDSIANSNAKNIERDRAQWFDKTASEVSFDVEGKKVLMVKTSAGVKQVKIAE